MSIDGKKIEQRKPRESEGKNTISSQQYKEIFYSKKSDLRVLQNKYESLPPVTLEKDHREKNIRHKFQEYNIKENDYTHIKLGQVRAKIQDINNTGRKFKSSDSSVAKQQDDLKKIEIALQASLEKKQQYESNLVRRVSELKGIVKEVRSLGRAQYTEKNGVDLVKAIQGSIKEAHITLVNNADHLGTNIHEYFHDSQLHPCPPELQMRMVQQETGGGDCGAACVTALYGTREKIASLRELSDDIYARYPSEDLNNRGTLMWQHVQVLADLGAQTESFSSTRDLRMKLNTSETINPIMTLIGRHDTNQFHYITISNTTIDHRGEEMIAFADPRTEKSHLVSFNEFLDVSRGNHLQLI